MEKEFQYTTKSTSANAPNLVIKCQNTHFDWSSSEELPHIQCISEQTLNPIMVYSNALELDSMGGETRPGYNYFDSSDTESVAEGMELNADEVGMLCDFIDGMTENKLSEQTADLPPETVNNVLEKVFKGGAALDSNEHRYQRDLKKRKENTSRLDLNEKVTMAEIWELIRCQEGYREHSSQALNRGAIGASEGHCGKIEFILEKEREAANQREMRKMQEQMEKLQKELNEIKLSRSPIGGNISINDDVETLPKKGILNTVTDFIFNVNNDDEKNKSSSCIIS